MTYLPVVRLTSSMKSGPSRTQRYRRKSQPCAERASFCLRVSFLPLNDDNESQGKIIACHGVGCDLRMYVQQSDFTIHSTTERLDQILKLDESCDYFYKIRIPRKIRKKLLVQLDAMGFHESSIYPDMEHIAKEQTTSHFNF